MSISNGDFTDESGRAVNLMALLRDGSVVESDSDHHMAHIQAGIPMKTENRLTSLHYFKMAVVEADLLR